MVESSLSARKAAVALIERWEGLPPTRRPPLSRLRQDWIPQIGGADPRREKALFTELTQGVIRWRLLLDHHLDALLQRPEKTPPTIKAILRVALYQLFFLPAIPPRAVVSEAVKLAAGSRHSWAKGVVNGVLRRLVREMEAHGGEAVRLKRLPQGPWPRRAAVAHSFPVWMVELLESELGRDGAEAVIEFSNQRPPLTLRVNTRAIGRDRFMKRLKGEGVAAAGGRYSPQAVILENPMPPSSIPGFQEGLFYLQDEAAQLASIILAPAQGERVLDLCGGVGGKTTHLAELAECSVWATDVNQQRLETLMANLNRLGTQGVQAVPRGRLRQGAPFHKILVDAPCSGLGVIRRHPDIKWNRTPEMLKELKQQQTRLVLEAASMLAPKGELLYCVCTFTRTETDEVVEEVLKRVPGIEVVDPAHRLPPPARHFVTERGFVRIAPEEGGPDLFFMALFRRR